MYIDYKNECVKVYKENNTSYNEKSRANAVRTFNILITTGEGRPFSELKSTSGKNIIKYKFCQSRSWGDEFVKRYLRTRV